LEKRNGLAGKEERGAPTPPRASPPPPPPPPPALPCTVAFAYDAFGPLEMAATFSDCVAENSKRIAVHQEWGRRKKEKVVGVVFCILFIQRGRDAKLRRELI
jgi:hypothetical protein